ncbi:MAG TPA: 50S ribosomal protein L17 [Armatimonadota bacterium]|nr:50S ribosomal protein L17 [Armatimonadota bacterium]
MKHRVSGRRLGRATDQRLALLKNLVTSLLWHGSVETTVARAKEARSMAEKLITIAKEDSVAHRRLVRRTLMPRTGLQRMKEGSHREAPATGEIEKSVQAGRSPSSLHNSVRHLFEHVAPQYQDRPGGYSRIIRIGSRRGDGADLVKLQLVEYVAPEA